MNGLLVHKLSAPSLIVTIGTHTIFDLLGANGGTLGLIEPLFPYIDYFMPRIEEARQISAAPDVEGAGRFFLERGVKHCFFTLGGDDVCFMDAASPVVRGRAFEIEVVEYDGCGDAFDAGYITALHHKMDLVTALTSRRQAPRSWRPVSVRMPVSALSMKHLPS